MCLKFNGRNYWKLVRFLQLLNNRLILNLRDASILEKSWPEIMSAVKSGINDADPEVRTYARKTFENLQANYPQRADFLYQVSF